MKFMSETESAELQPELNVYISENNAKRDEKKFKFQCFIFLSPTYF